MTSPGKCADCGSHYHATTQHAVSLAYFLAAVRVSQGSTLGKPMTKLDQVRDRYRHDTMFHTYVDMMRKAIGDLHLTPGELRDAAMLAALIEEERRSLPVCLRCGNVLESLAHAEECLSKSRV